VNRLCLGLVSSRRTVPASRKRPTRTSSNQSRRRLIGSCRPCIRTTQNPVTCSASRTANSTSTGMAQWFPIRCGNTADLRQGPAGGQSL